MLHTHTPIDTPTHTPTQLYTHALRLRILSDVILLVIASTQICSNVFLRCSLVSNAMYTSTHGPREMHKSCTLMILYMYPHAVHMLIDLCSHSCLVFNSPFSMHVHTVHSNMTYVMYCTMNYPYCVIIHK